MSSDRFISADELYMVEDFNDLRNMYDERGLKYDFSIIDILSAKSIEIVENIYNKAKSIVKGTDFSYINEIDFIKDTFVYERTMYEKFLDNQEKRDEARENIVSDGVLPGYDTKLGGLDLHLRAVVDSYISDIPSGYRTDVMSEIIGFREKGFTVLSQEVSEIIPLAHLVLSRRRYRDFYDMEDKEGIGFFEEIKSGSSNPKIYEGLYKPFRDVYYQHIRSKELDGHIESKNWEEILMNEEGFSLPKNIDRSFMEKWYPVENDRKHKRLERFADIVMDFTRKKKAAGRDFDDVYVVASFFELPILKQYFEDISPEELEVYEKV